MKTLLLLVCFLVAAPTYAKWVLLVHESEQGETTYVSSDGSNRMSMSCSNNELAVGFEFNQALSTQRVEGDLTFEAESNLSRMRFKTMGVSTPFNRTFFSLHERSHGKDDIVAFYKAMLLEDTFTYSISVNGEFLFESQNTAGLERELKKSRCFASALNITHDPNPKALWTVDKQGIFDRVSRGAVQYRCAYGSPASISFNLSSLMQNKVKDGVLEIVAGFQGYKFEQDFSVNSGIIQLLITSSQKERFNRLLQDMMKAEELYFSYWQGSKKLAGGSESLLGFSSAVKEARCSPKSVD